MSEQPPVLTQNSAAASKAICQAGHGSECPEKGAANSGEVKPLLAYGFRLKDQISAEMTVNNAAKASITIESNIILGNLRIEIALVPYLFRIGKLGNCA